MARIISEEEINNLIQLGDILDAQNEGVIPGGTYSLTGEQIIAQNDDIYRWLRSKNDPRFIGTILEAEKGITTDKQIEAAIVIDYISYNINGKIIDSPSSLPVSEAILTTETNGSAYFITSTTKTNNEGEFNLIGKYVKGEVFNINLSKKDFSPTTIFPFNMDGEIKENLGLILLNPSQADLENSIRDEINLTEPQVKLIQLSKMDFEMAKQQAMNRVIEQIKVVLIPQVLTLIAQFGISSATKAIGKKFGDMNANCPSNLEEINILISKKNKLTKALNNIYNFLNTIKIGVEFLDKTITIAQIAVQVIQAIFFVFPVAGFGAPDFGRPLGKIIDKIEKELRKYKLISSSTLLVLTILIQILQKILEYLSLLDSLITGCSIEGQLSQEQLSADLLKSTQEQSNASQGGQSPVVTNVNGFEMEVISVDNITVGGLKRRQAIAKNKAKITMLRGEPSFSSNDQILIDELVYYIQINDLKAD